MRFLLGIKAVTWDSATRFIVLFNGLSNVVLGVSFLLFSNSAGESVLSRLFPADLWPTLWIVAGIVGVMGLWSVSLARVSFYMCGSVMLVFTFASAWAVIVDGRITAIPATVFLLYLSVLLFGFARVLQQRDAILQTVLEVTQLGQKKLDEASNNA